MSGSQELAVREKQEVAQAEEKTIPGRYYVPVADIQVENDVLRVEGKIDYSAYKDVEPVYTEYYVGHYARGFTLSNRVDRGAISARLNEGVLVLTIPKAKEALPRRIAVS